ncbi:MAG: Crp/Fnr family transcriptional regulator [Chloroflexi bacterium]|nr:Crp/Fnr family transcriptional regulator [Chloroflexota bacterium]
MTNSIQTLHQLPFFARLSDDVLRKVARVLHQRTYSPGQVIVLEGEPCQAVYFVAQGLVRTRRISLEGREQVLAYLGPGESFGLVPAVDNGLNPATVDAVTDASLYIIPCQHFRQIMRHEQDVASAALLQLAAEVRRLSDMVEDLALHSVSTRLARFLLMQAEEGQPRRSWTQEEIAAQIGTVREVVGRTMRAFAAAGLIRRQRGRLVVVDRERLEREAAGG